MLPPEGSFARWKLEKEMLDPSFRAAVKAMSENAYYRIWTQSNNGATLQMDAALREFLIEYNARSRKHGLHQLPSNFNVMEAFYNFQLDPGIFSLLPEIDHLFSMPALIDYVTTKPQPEAEFDLNSLLRESVIYSYNVCSSLDDQLFSVANNVQFAIGGISIVRHGRELSAVMLCGEQTDLKKRSQEAATRSELHKSPSQEFIFKRSFGPDPESKPEAVPLLGSSNFARSLVLARIDLIGKTFDARYLLSDAGDHYNVRTDDYSCGLPPRELALISEELARYEALFHAVRVMLHLPSFFNDKKSLISTEKRETQLEVHKNTTTARKAKQRVPSQEFLKKRTIVVLDQIGGIADLALFTPPRVVVETKGYWKSLRHDEVGTDKDGKPIHGRTWVEEKATWLRPDRWQLLSVSKPTAYQESTSPSSQSGHIYVMRCVTHAENIFKVGLTRRRVDERAAELSASTSSPTVFYPVLSWDVSDCVAAEREIHTLLDAFRVSGSREFFCAPIAVITRIADPVIRRYSLHASS